jgi:hypothetical protein
MATQKSPACFLQYQAVVKPKILSGVLASGIALLVAGCAGLYRDNLAESYQNGSLSAADYHRLVLQRDAQRQAYLQQYQASQRQQQQDIENSYQQMKVANDKQLSDFSEQMTRSSIATQAIFQQQQSPAFPNATFQQEPKLPTAWDKPKSTDWQTGSVKTGPDGRMWHEYTTSSGYKYWRVDQ